MFVDPARSTIERRYIAKAPGYRGYGRFLEPDPIGYADSPNLYAYVGNDPVNLTDPLGLLEVNCAVDICVTGTPFGPSEPGQGAGIPGQVVGVGIIPQGLYYEGGGGCPIDEGAGEHVYVTGQKPKPTNRTGNLRDLFRSAWRPVRSVVCSMPAVGFGGGFDGYAGVGGSVSGGYSFDLKRGKSACLAQLVSASALVAEHTRQHT